MSDEFNNSDQSIQLELYVSRVVYAATSKGYRHAIAVATSPSYAEEIMKAKLPTCLRGDIETLTLPRHEIDDDGRKTVTAWVPNQVPESL